MADYDFKNPDTKRDLEALQNKFEHLGETNSSEGNETERSLSGQLILLTTVLITATVLALGDSNIVSKITHAEKKYVFCILLLEALATFAGILNYLRIERSYDAWAKIQYRCAAIIKERNYKRPDELERSLNREQDEICKKPRIALWVQVGSITVSLLLYLVLLFRLLF